MTNFGSIVGFDYLSPASLDEVLRILESNGADSRVLNGGSDLVLQMKQGTVTPKSVVDIKGIPELNRLEWDQDKGLRLGVAVPLKKLLSFTSLPKEYDVLLQGSSVIGSVQVKNRGTVGGNIRNAAPSADSAPLLLCLEARAILASTKGTRAVIMDDFFTVPGQTVIGNDELLVELEVPLPPSPAVGCYLRYTTREEMDIAVAGVASFLVLSPQSRKVEQARLALGTVAPTPFRARQAEACLLGKEVTPDIIEEAAEQAVEEVNPISDIRASAGYRRHLIKVLTCRTLQKVSEELGIKV